MAVTTFREGYLVVKDMQNKELYRQDLAWDNDIHDFCAKYKSVPTVSLLAASFWVVRLDNLEDFATDLFLPTFINHALRIKNVAARIVMSVLAIIWDLLTLIPRILTLPWRYCAIVEHPILPLINNDEESKRAGLVKVSFHTIHDIEGLQGAWTACLQKKAICLKELPQFAIEEERWVRSVFGNGDETYITKYLDGVEVSSQNIPTKDLPKE